MKKILFISAIAAVFAACCPTDKTKIEVVPYPNSVDMRCGSFAAAGEAMAAKPSCLYPALWYQRFDAQLSGCTISS